MKVYVVNVCNAERREWGKGGWWLLTGYVKCICSTEAGAMATMKRKALNMAHNTKRAKSELVLIDKHHIVLPAKPGHVKHGYPEGQGWYISVHNVDATGAYRGRPTNKKAR